MSVPKKRTARLKKTDCPSQKNGPHRITNSIANLRQRTATSPQRTSISPHRTALHHNDNVTQQHTSSSPQHTATAPQHHHKIYRSLTAAHINFPTTNPNLICYAPKPHRNLTTISTQSAAPAHTATAIYALHSTIIHCNVIILCYHLADIMSRASLLYGEQALLDEYNQYVVEKLNVTLSETGRKSNTTLGFARGMQQMMEDVDTFNPYHSYLGLHESVGGLFDTKKQFHRLISLLLADLGLIFDIRSSSPWQVIAELQNRGIVGESDSASLKVGLSIANEIRLKTYYANGGQKELFSPLLQSTNAAEQSTEVPIFRDFDEDILVRLLATSNDMYQRCRLFCSTYTQQGEVDASVLRIPTVWPSKAKVSAQLYSRLQNFPKALDSLKSVPKGSPDYAGCMNCQGVLYMDLGEYEKAIECFEIATECVQNEVVAFLFNLATALLRSSQFIKAKIKMEEALWLDNEISRDGEETIVSNRIMLSLGILFYENGDMGSAIESFQKVEQSQKQLKSCGDMDVILLNLYMALALSVSNEQSQHDQTFVYLGRVLKLSHQIFGEHNLSSELSNIYLNVGKVYANCKLNDEALSWYERNLELLKSVHGDTPNAGEIQSMGRA